MPGDRQRPTLAVIVIPAELDVVFERDERTQHLRPAPPIAAEPMNPRVVIIRRAAEGDQRVDRGRTANPTTTQIRRYPLLCGAHGPQLRPDPTRNLQRPSPVEPRHARWCLRRRMIW